IEMRTRTIVARAVAFAFGLPLAVGLIAGTAFYGIFSYFAPNRINGAIVVSGQRREYLLHVPPSVDAATPVPLVISLHGAALWPATQMEMSQWNRVADEHGFIVVYPAGTGLLGRIGGILPFRAWILGPTASNIAWCVDSTPMPVISFHGTADPLVPYEGGKAWAAPRPFPSARSWMTLWARRNRCAPVPADSVLGPDVSRREYQECANDAAVLFYTIRGAGHTWPGGKPLPAWLVGSTTRSIDATAEMWRFFR